jgi:hypothetical protein
MRKEGTARVFWIETNTAWMRWHRASLRHDLRQIGALGGEETDEEREIRLAGPPSLAEHPPSTNEDDGD